MTRRPLYPNRDTMRAAFGIHAGQAVAFLIITAVVLAPDTIVSALTGGF